MIVIPRGGRPISYDETLTIALLLGLTVVSVQYGRGVWRPRPKWRVLGIVASVIAAVMFVPVIEASVDSHAEDAFFNGLNSGHDIGSGSRAGGAFIDDKRADNLFVYGPSGELIDGARIVDQDGRPLRIDQGDPSDFSPSKLWQPRRDATDAHVWNAYPVTSVENGDEMDETEAGALVGEGDEVMLDPNATLPAPRSPFETLPPLQDRAVAPVVAEAPALP